METAKQNQRKAILTYLQQGNSITQLSAFGMFECLRLSARIYDLRQLGHEIKTTMAKAKNGNSYAVYSLQK